MDCYCDISVLCLFLVVAVVWCYDHWNQRHLGNEIKSERPKVERCACVHIVFILLEWVVVDTKTMQRLLISLLIENFLRWLKIFGCVVVVDWGN